jgi:hypothetical protein
MLQEEANKISLCQFSKMSQWGEITGTPTTRQPRESPAVNDYWLKCGQLK